MINLIITDDHQIFINGLKSIYLCYPDVNGRYSYSKKIMMID